MALAARLAAGPTLAYAEAKRAIHAAALPTLPDVLAGRARGPGAARQTAITRTRRAFLAKQRPAFHARWKPAGEPSPRAARTGLEPPPPGWPGGNRGGQNEGHDPRTRAPLDGITVLGLEQAIAAPLCTRHLADLGARVIKIEQPGAGDTSRHYDGVVRGMSAHFPWLNHGRSPPRST